MANVGHSNATIMTTSFLVIPAKTVVGSNSTASVMKRPTCSFLAVHSRKSMPAMVNQLRVQIFLSMHVRQPQVALLTVPLGFVAMQSALS